MRGRLDELIVLDYQHDLLRPLDVVGLLAQRSVVAADLTALADCRVLRRVGVDVDLVQLQPVEKLLLILYLLQ